MDPNEIHRQFREAMKEAQDLSNELSDIESDGTVAPAKMFEQRSELLEKAAYLAWDLDDWLSSGGFLPTAWAKR